jgi:hypothetical protein
LPQTLHSLSPIKLIVRQPMKLLAAADVNGPSFFSTIEMRAHYAHRDFDFLQMTLLP